MKSTSSWPTKPPKRTQFLFVEAPSLSRGGDTRRPGVGVGRRKRSCGFGISNRNVRPSRPLRFEEIKTTKISTVYGKCGELWKSKKTRHSMIYSFSVTQSSKSVAQQNVLRSTLSWAERVQHTRAASIKSSIHKKPLLTEKTTSGRRTQLTKLFLRRGRRNPCPVASPNARGAISASLSTAKESEAEEECLGFIVFA